MSRRTTDPDALWLAHHEAGHLVAATMRGAVWDYATIVPVPPYEGHVCFQPDGAFLDPANRAFIYWAGPYAQAKATGRTMNDVCSDRSSSHDRAVFGSFRTPRQDARWSEELDAVWPMVEACAARLLLTDVLLPDQPDPLRDSRAISDFVSGIQHSPSSDQGLLPSP